MSLTAVPPALLRVALACRPLRSCARRGAGGTFMARGGLLARACRRPAYIFSPTITMQETSLHHVPVPSPPGAISYLKRRARQ
ncbi:hypothetical protein EDB83DRAFT_182932 [Lactarius deliciosus]|nr:hypothetical protein EDB83DRAFT_182932 [Lactarius deliciosus]